MLNLVNKNYVMVIGSKPEAALSKIIPYKIYAANGALERATVLKKKTLKFMLFPLLAIHSLTTFLLLIKSKNINQMN